MQSIFLILFTAVFAENFIFTRFFGICPFFRVSEKPLSALYMGAGLTVVMTLSSAVAWGVYHGILVPFGLEYLKTMVFVLLTALLVQGAAVLVRKLLPAVYAVTEQSIPLLTANCAVLGALLLHVEEQHTLAESLVFGLAAALGYTLAVVIFAGIRERLVLADPPEAFRGFPLLLVSAGLAAMAFSGFAGVRFS